MNIINAMWVRLGIADNRESNIVKSTFVFSKSIYGPFMQHVAYSKTSRK